MTGQFTGSTESKMVQFLAYIVENRGKVQGMIRDSPAGVSSGSGASGGGSGGGSGGSGNGGAKQNAFFTKSKAPFRDENCRICRELDSMGDTEDIYEDHCSKNAYGCPRFAKMNLVERRNMVLKARLCWHCLDNKWVRKGGRNEGCPAFVKKQNYTCNACKTHFLVCEKHRNQNEEKLENSKKYWNDRGKDFSMN